MHITDYATGLASEMGVKLSRVALIDGGEFDCTDAYVVDLISGGKLVGALVYRKELEALKQGVVSVRLEVKLRKALKCLHTLVR